ncbi:MAG TPA: GtrA family protein [Azospirillaceae bacterium]|nr:GtrA family protein [Azospirillaceae bacterium]
MTTGSIPYPPRLPRSLIRFGTVGVANSATDYFLFMALRAAGFGLVPANALAYGLATVQSFALNKRWTFGDDAAGAAALRQFGLFAGINLVSLGISTLTVWNASQVVSEGAAKLLAIAAGFVWNYVFSRLLVFRGGRGQ